MYSVYTLITELFSVVATIANKFWDILTTPVATYIEAWNLPWWLQAIISDPLMWLFGSKGTLLSAIPVLIGLIILIRLVALLFGR